MVLARHCGWLKLLVAVVLFSINCNQVEATFVPKESCGFATTDVLQVNSKMFLQSGDITAVATTPDGQKLFFPHDAVYKVNIKGNTLMIDALPPHVMKYRLPNITQLNIQFGDLNVSCMEDRRKAQQEFDIVEMPTASSSSSAVSPDIESPATSVSSDGTSPISGPGVAKSFDDIRSDGGDLKEQPAPDTNMSSKPITTQITEVKAPVTTLMTSTEKKPVTLPMDIKSEVRDLKEQETKMSSKPITTRTTEVKAPPVTTLMTSMPITPMKPIPSTHSVILETNDEMSAKPVPTIPIPQAPIVETTTPEKELSDITEALSPRTVTLDVTTPSEAFGTQSTLPKTSTEESHSNLSMVSNRQSSNMSWDLKDLIPYIAGGTIFLFLIILVILIVCTVQRKRAQRRSPDNHEDLFITTTFDETLLRNYEGGHSNNAGIRMYSAVEPETVKPEELEERVLGDTTVKMEPEKPRCLAGIDNEV